MESESEELQYLNLISDIIKTGNKKSDRTGVGTISKFGCSMRFSLRNNTIPLLTTKKVFWKGVVEELLWFIAGDTNSNHLSEKDVKIWDANGSREYLDKIGLSQREQGDLGPIYSHQWRHYGAEYTNCHDDYTGKGIDQLQTCINKIKTNPDDRRIILCSWNPVDIAKMALPPCHVLCQFYVSEMKCNSTEGSEANEGSSGGELSCLMYQRSCDMGLGVPFNIASYSLLTVLIANICGLKPGEFIHSMGDTHVYINHIEQLQEQITRVPRQFPTVRINRKVENIDDFKSEDIELCGYDPHPGIKMEMAV